MNIPDVSKPGWAEAYRNAVIEECAMIADHDWGLMFTKSENRTAARTASALIAKAIREKISVLKTAQGEPK